MAVYRETQLRSLSKTISYRVATIAADLIIVYILTRRADVTIGVTLFTNIASSLLYYSHERVWNHVGWGQKRVRR
jgi:uncharacterized membrane protein